MGVQATVRASLAFYNRRSDLEALAAGVRKVRETFA
jgi:selenocysteine lyase/cysteine desulfurase